MWHNDLPRLGSLGQDKAELRRRWSWAIGFTLSQALVQWQPFLLASAATDQKRTNKHILALSWPQRSCKLFGAEACFSANPSVRSGTAREDLEAASLWSLNRSRGCQFKITSFDSYTSSTAFPPERSGNVQLPPESQTSHLSSMLPLVDWSQLFPLHANFYGHAFSYFILINHIFIIVAHARHLPSHFLENNVSLNIEDG